MRILDSYIDTYEKRKYLIYSIICICGIVFSLMHILLGLKLLPIETYEDVLSLVDQKIVQQAYFGRNALQLLNIQVLNVSGYLYHLIQLETFEWIYFVGNMFLLFTSKSKIGYLNLYIYIFAYVYMIIMFLLGIHSGSLYEIMNYIRLIGIGIMIAYFILLIVQVIEIIKSIRKYRESLQYQVIILE